MKIAIQVSGLAVILASILAGMYVGIGVCLVGGIVTIIEVLDGTIAAYAATTVAWALVKIFFFWVAGVATIIPGFVVGFIMFHFGD